MLTTRDRSKGRPQCHLGFTKADITTDQTIHRLARAHIREHGINGDSLVDSFFKAKAIGKAFVVTFIEMEGVTLTGSASGIERQ